MDLMGNYKSGSSAKAVIVGLGNPYRTDDGVGVAVVRALKADDASPIMEFLESAHGGLPLAQALVGFGRALIVDAAPFLPVGEVSLFPLSPEHGSRITGDGGWAHGLGLAQALALLSAAGEDIPEVWALGVGVPGDPPFGEELSAEVAAAVPKAIVEVKRWLRAGF